jgi:hypothetical protein
MSTDRDTTRAVRSWLEEGVTVLPDRVLDGVLDQLPATRQRRSPWRGFTIGGVSRGMRFAIAAAAVLIAIVGLELAPGILSPIGATPSPSASPVPTAQPSPTEPIETPLAPGTYSLEGFPVATSFTVPEGWIRCATSPLEQGVCRVAGDVSVSILIVTNVVADPCADALLDPPPGPSVDDLVAAISGMPDFTITAPVDIHVDGFAGKELTVNPPKLFRCSTLLTWATADRINGVGADESNLIRIVDVDGTRVVMAGAYQQLGSDTSDVIPSIRQVMDSVNFTP